MALNLAASSTSLYILYRVEVPLTRLALGIHSTGATNSDIDN